ncbi:MAG: phosphoribosylanthranilate isomerase [bacterium]
MVKVKICGITNLIDALEACELDADALGFIFHKKSPRYIQPVAAKDIMKSLPPFIIKVGVFVNMTLSDLYKICESVPIDVVQLHGDETPEYCRQISYPCLKVFRVNADFNLLKLKKYQTAGYLLDTFNNYIYGGTGKTFDWNIAKEANKFGRVVLSGGLNSDNILKALDFVRPYAVDICSGVEAFPGKKDPEKLKTFFEEFRKFKNN